MRILIGQMYGQCHFLRSVQLVSPFLAPSEVQSGLRPSVLRNS